MRYHKYKEWCHMDSLMLYNLIKIIKRDSKAEFLKELLKHSFTDLYKCHYNYGMWIRNNYLYNNYKVYNFFNNIGITDMDEISMLLIQLLYIDLKYHDKTD